MIYNNDNEEELDALLQRDGTLALYKRNLQRPMVDMYKMTNHLHSPYMWDIFTKKVVEYDLKNSNTLRASTCQITEIWYKFIET